MPLNTYNITLDFKIGNSNKFPDFLLNLLTLSLWAACFLTFGIFMKNKIENPSNVRQCLL